MNLKRIFHSNLILSFVPVMLGAALAWGDGIQDGISALVSGIGICLVLTSLCASVTQTSRRLFHLLMSGPCWVYLSYHAGLPISWVSIITLVASFFYIKGKIRFVSTGIKEFLIFCFGPLAVCIVYFSQSFEINLSIIVSGMAVGLFAVALTLILNLNHRDKDLMTDQKTIPIRLGLEWGQQFFMLSLLGAFLVPILVYKITHEHIRILWSSGLSLFAVPIIHSVLTIKDKDEPSASIAATQILMLLYGLVFSWGWVSS